MVKYALLGLIAGFFISCGRTKLQDNAELRLEDSIAKADSIEHIADSVSFEKAIEKADSIVPVACCDSNGGYVRSGPARIPKQK